MFQITFYVPVSHAEKVKESMFRAGAGRVGNYDCCSFESKGLGQFRPLQGSLPFMGKHGEIEQVEELKVEMVCEDEFLTKAITEMKASHPYETPAYYVTEMVRI